MKKSEQEFYFITKSPPGTTAGAQNSSQAAAAMQAKRPCSLEILLAKPAYPEAAQPPSA